MENFTAGLFLGLTTSVLVSLAAYMGWKYSADWRSNWTSHWRRVGTLEEILCYPLKSGAAVQLNSAICDVHGMQANDDNNFRIQDRCFVVFNPYTNSIVTVRDYPKLVLMKWQESGEDYVIFDAPGMPPITVAKPTCTKENRRLCRMWNGDETHVMDFGDDPALWLTRYLDLECIDMVRLGYFCPKYCQGRNFGSSLQVVRDTYPKIDRRDFGLYCDSVPYTLLTDATMDELKKRLGGLRCAVDTEWFRPNFVVGNSSEFEEDTWNYIKIGDETVFQNVMPCKRDPSCCVNPSTGLPTENGEPFLTLRKFRCGISDCKREGPLPEFGIGLGLRQMGTIRVGDGVYVSDNWNMSTTRRATIVTDDGRYLLPGVYRISGETSCVPWVDVKIGMTIMVEGTAFAPGTFNVMGGMRYDSPDEMLKLDPKERKFRGWSNIDSDRDHYSGNIKCTPINLTGPPVKMIKHVNDPTAHDGIHKYHIVGEIRCKNRKTDDPGLSLIIESKIPLRSVYRLEGTIICEPGRNEIRGVSLIPLGPTHLGRFRLNGELKMSLDEDNPVKNDEKPNSPKEPPTSRTCEGKNIVCKLCQCRPETR